MSVPRGPCPLHVLKDCWVQGIVDENTLVWGQVSVRVGLVGRHSGMSCHRSPK